MPAKPRALLLFSTLIGFPLLVAFCQDAPSLGDTARRTRQQEQEKDQPGKAPSAPKAARVVTDDDTPPRAGATDQPSKADPQHVSKGGSPATVAKLTAEQWKARILAKKSAISTMQSQIDKINDSIRFVAATCTGCEEWNERQLQKKQEVERARAELEKQKKVLEDMQEAARQQGYGSSVYDP